MRNKLFRTFLAAILCFLLVGCGKKEGSPFTMTCTSAKNTDGGMESQTVVTYHFNEEQLATDYTSATTQKFKDKDTYETYKAAQKETVNNNSEATISYALETDDKNLTLVFKMDLKDLDKNAVTEEDRNIIRAKRILKSNEERKSKCTLDGIKKRKLK